PRLAGVLADEEAAAGRLDESEDAAGPRTGSGDADLPPRAFGEPLVRLADQPGPRVSSVGRAPERAARAAADELPRPPYHLPEARVENPRVARVHRKIRGSGPVVHEEHLRPRAPTVGGAVDPAVGIRTEGMALRGDVHDVGVGRVDADPRDV